MSNLFQIGLSGLGAARAGLNTTGNNMSNVNTVGYTRRTTTLAETAGSGQGNGVTVTGIQRHYAQFLTSQLNSAQSTAAATSSHLDQMSQIDNLLSDSDAGVGPRMQDFFDSLAGLAGSPSDASARNAVLGAADNMAGRFRSFAGTLSDMGKAVDKQLNSAVAQVNTNASEIARLNDKIATTQSRTGQPPNNLLDQRDQLVTQTAKLVDVDVTQNDNGSYNLAVGGQAIVDSTGSHALRIAKGEQDPTQPRLFYTGADGVDREIPNDRVAGGEIGGLLSFATDSLDPIQAKLDQTAHDLAVAVNAQHEAGTDLAGNPGQALFNINGPSVYAGQRNTGNASLTATFDPQQTSAVTADQYRVTYDDDSGYRVTRAGDGSTVEASFDPDTNTLAFGGLDVTVSGTPDDGDAFSVRPLDGAAAAFSVAVSDPAHLAAGQGNGKGDNTNASALADLQQADTVEGNRSFADNYSQLVGDIGNRTQALQVNADSQSAITDELTQAQQSVAGVNLEEENVNLMYYQQMYQANARVIQTASNVFDTILGLGN
ncbi:flagellar hook-associated protein FlgK [Salinisphaera sp. Q1T1-3]|uniref:flagellar hook-associated protein FlgK n=1 Tax=Salinisphaera sp. Q1T1-3 TaxID=2321229 RepID=UPI000E70EC58|nr:flagellar hook-associated protein FlgK [Salinisphaera sp. Q1T1-3]RJS95163.1 flagellar hook-associated protein FlgK [Salinisphaera sp. Q1T1-3]